MIVVLLGTNPYSFERLVKAVDELAARKNWDIFVQLGNTRYEPVHCSFERFVDKKNLRAKIYNSEMVICHGGFGSIRDALAANKTVVAVPRKPELGESQDHQIELVTELEAQGRILVVYDIERLPATVEKAKVFRPVENEEKKRIPEIITKFLEEM